MSPMMRWIRSTFCLAVVVGSAAAQQKPKPPTALRVDLADRLKNTFSLSSIKATADEAILPMTLSAREAEDLEIVVERSRGPASNKATPLGSVRELKLGRGDLAVVRAKGDAPSGLELGDRTTAAAANLVFVPTNAASAGEVVSAMLCMRLQNDPLPWSGGEKRFVTDLRIWLKSTSGGDEPLPKALPVAFFVRGNGGEVDPTTVSLKKLGLGGSVSVRVARRTSSGDVAVEAESTLGKQQIDLLAGDGGRNLSLTSRQSSIYGLGLESTEITVSLRNADGSAAPAPEELNVSLHGDRGEFPAVLTIAKGESANDTTFRSLGVGDVQLWAEAGGIVAPKLTISLLWPKLLTAFTVVGGFLGGALRRTTKKPPRATRERIHNAIIGAVLGVLFTSAVLTGLWLVQFDRALLLSEAGALVVSFAAGLNAPAVQRRLGSLLGSAKQSDED